MRTTLFNRPIFNNRSKVNNSNNNIDNGVDWCFLSRPSSSLSSLVILMTTMIIIIILSVLPNSMATEIPDMDSGNYNDQIDPEVARPTSIIVHESDIQAAIKPDHKLAVYENLTKDRKYQDFFKRHLTLATNQPKSNEKAISFDNISAVITVASTATGTGTGTGTGIAMARSRMPYGMSKGLLDIRKANEHYLKVHTEARCRHPRPRVVKVKEFYPDPSKEYLPSCTVLYHCSDDTGCCDSDTMQCVAKRQEVVQLNFYKLHLSGGGIGMSGADTVEKLSFVNDTECECQVVDDRPRFIVRKTMCLQCPSGFTLREQQSGTCSCDCFDKQKSCLKMKRGREMLPETDRRCVESRRCHQPDCEYGIYDGTVGRCPKKSERKRNGNGNATGHHIGHHWWKLNERD